MSARRLAAVALAVLACAAPASAAAGFGGHPARAFDAYFSRCGPGWNGGDSGYSFALKGALLGKVAWLWSDTYLGYVRADGTPDGRRATTKFGLPPFIRNSITIQPTTGVPTTSTAPDNFVTLFGARVGEEAQRISSAPRPVLGPRSSARAFSPFCYEPQVVYRSLVRTSDDDSISMYWAGDGVVEPDGRLKLIYRRMRFRGPDLLDVDWRANVVATFTPTVDGSLRLDAIDPAPGSRAVPIRWGSATLPGGQFVYVYGVRKIAGRGSANRLYVARVRAGQLQTASAWRFWTGRRWGSRAAAARSIGTGVDDEFSVVRTRGRVVLVSVDLTDGLAHARAIRRWVARRPAGPFRADAELYRMPEVADSPRGLFVYSAHVHPTFTRGRDWLVSYSVLGPDHLHNVDNYRPRFAWIRDIGR